MNRAERRSGGWDKFTPQGDYDHFVSETDENTQKVLMLLLREPLGGMEGDMDDRRLYEAIRELIGAGCLDLYFRFGHGGVGNQSGVENSGHRHVRKLSVAGAALMTSLLLTIAGQTLRVSGEGLCIEFLNSPETASERWSVTTSSEPHGMEDAGGDSVERHATNLTGSAARGQAALSGECPEAPPMDGIREEPSGTVAKISHSVAPIPPGETDKAGDTPPPMSPAAPFTNPRCIHPDTCHLIHSREECFDCTMAWSQRPKDEQIRLWAEAIEAARAQA